MKKEYIWLSMLLFCRLEVTYAQQIAQDTLPMFEVVSNRLPASNPGLMQEQFDSSNPWFNQGNSLGELFSKSASMFVRINSPGALASASLRGMGPVHTALIWNGFNLQSSMNGQTDLNLISPLLFDQITLQQGSGNALWGSNASAGTIHLNENYNNNRVEFGQTAGSWHSNTTYLKAGIAKNKISGNIRAFTTKSVNNYRFADLSQQNYPVKTQQHASYTQQALLANMKLKISKKDFMHLSGWMQQSDRQLPSLVVIPLASAQQYDNTLRASFNWTHYLNSGDIQIRSAYLREKILFKDSLLSLDAHNAANSLIQEAEFMLPIAADYLFQAGITHTYSSAQVDGYHSKLKIQRRAALFASLRGAWLKQRIQALTALRQEWYDAGFAPLTPSLSASWQLSSALLIRSQFAGTFRIPTMNDLYWIPGGNPQLKPETGRSAELSLQYQFKRERFTLNWSAGTFSNQIRNRILWEPGANYWQPSNLGNVSSTGLQSNLLFSYLQQNQGWQIALNTQYVMSGEVQKDWQMPQFQLIYTPRWQAGAFVQYHYRSLNFFVQTSYTGSRYTSSDNAYSLPGYILTDAGVNVDLPIPELPANLFLSCNNLFNKAYEIISLRPMPLRSWYAGINFHFNFKPSINK